MDFRANVRLGYKVLSEPLSNSKSGTTTTPKMALLIMTILLTLNRGKFTNNAITYSWFDLKMTLLITANKKRIWYDTFINVIS